MSRVTSAGKARETRDEVTIVENLNKSIESAGKHKKYKQIESVEKMYEYQNIKVWGKHKAADAGLQRVHKASSGRF